MSPAATPRSPLPGHRPTNLRRGEAPFLVWPVSRREFYMSIAVALFPPVAWGMIVFGWRMIVLLGVTLFPAVVLHALLKHWTKRGKNIVFAHTVLATMVLVALCPVHWPAWLPALAAAAIPCILWFLGGPGKERVHTAVLLVIILQFLVPVFTGGSNADGGEGIVARNRLLMGDIRNQKEGSLYRWPVSSDLGGNDAVHIERPQRVALRTLSEISAVYAHPPSPAPASSPAVTQPSTPPSAQSEARNILDHAIGQQLPSVEMLMLGAVPARCGAASLIALVLGGLYLAYRYILRPKSIAIFFLSYTLALTALAIPPVALHQLGWRGTWEIWSTFPGEIATLLSYAVFNSDIIFAAVIVLALPGTEPLTNRGRRVFLIIAGIAAAILARLNLDLPAASLVLSALMPLAQGFDRWFGKRSWMNRLRI